MVRDRWGRAPRAGLALRDERGRRVSLASARRMTALSVVRERRRAHDRPARDPLGGVLAEARRARAALAHPAVAGPAHARLARSDRPAESRASHDSSQHS